MSKNELLASAFSSLMENAVNEKLDQRLTAIENGLAQLSNLIREVIDSNREDQLLNKRQVCQLLKTTYPTLRSLEKRGVIKPVISDQGTIRFSKREILQAKSKLRVA